LDYIYMLGNGYNSITHAKPPATATTTHEIDRERLEAMAVVCIPPCGPGGGVEFSGAEVAVCPAVGIVEIAELVGCCSLRAVGELPGGVGTIFEEAAAQLALYPSSVLLAVGLIAKTIPI
jgi:hypothetical protein